MPCKHTRIEGKKYRVVSPRKTKRLPKGSKILIPSKGRSLTMRRRKKHPKIRVWVRGHYAKGRGFVKGHYRRVRKHHRR